MKTDYRKMFEPIEIGKLKLKNRTSMAPMGLVLYADAHGGFNDEARDYYVERAKGEVGLIITGICSVNYDEIPDISMPCPTYNPLKFMESAKKMNGRVHSYGSKIFLQLTAGVGRSLIPAFIKKAIAPSDHGNRFDPSIMHKEITIEEIKKLEADFVKSAVIAKKSGFDGVEIHAVHEGYLLDQFAMSIFNQRTDEYGGSLENRLRISTNIVKGIKAACGEDFTVSLRYSVKSFMKAVRQGALPGEQFDEVGKDYDEGIEAAKILVDAGYDILNVDAGAYDSWYWNHPPMYFDKGMYREFGKLIKENVDVPVILAGRMDDTEVIADALENSCDIISFGRPLLADPYIVSKYRKEEIDDIRPCLSCHDGCMGHIAKGLPLSCAVNPACGQETKYALTPALQKKKVLIVGGGPAGMEAARVLAIRGHEPLIVEATNKLGGSLIAGGVPSFKSDDKELIKWYEKQLKDLNVNVKFNTKATKEMVEQSGVDYVILATGAKPILPDFGNENNIYPAVDVLLDKSKAGDDIVVVGAGLIGCEIGLWLKEMGKNVTIVEKASDALGGPHGLPAMNYFMLKDLIKYKNIDLKLNSEVEKVNANSVTVNGEEIKADTVVLAVGYKSENTLFNELSDLKTPIYNIGDSREVDNIMSAVWSGYEVARGIE